MRNPRTLRIELHGYEPAIWWRIEVDGSMVQDRGRRLQPARGPVRGHHQGIPGGGAEKRQQGPCR
jgi:hypothetical protein